MPGFSTLSVGGTIVSPLRLNYDLSVTGNSTVALAYSNAGITDIVGLQVVIYNNSTSSITLTAGSQFDNYTSYPGYCSVINQVVVPARQSITLQTTVIGQDYTIEAISGMLNLDGGSAGALAYQTAANRTGFLAAGTPNYILESGGPGQPPYWNQLTTGNLSGGVAGSLVWQSAANTTSKSAVGTAFGNSGGGMAGMIGTNTAGWIQTNLAGGLTQSSYSGGNLTLQQARAYQVNTQDIASGTSGNLYNWFTNAGIAQLDGNVYTVFNNSSSNYVLTIKNIQNPNSWSSSLITSFAANTNQITLYPNETITFQQYNSTYLTIVQTSQCLQLAASYSFVEPANNAPPAPWNLSTSGSTNFDPQGWLKNSYKITPNRPGNYLISVTYGLTGNVLGSDAPLFSIQKNGTNFLNCVYRPPGTNAVTNQGTMIVNCNGTTDYIALNRTTTFATSSWLGYPATNVTVMMLT